MLLNLTKEISYVGVPPQLQPLRQYVKQSRVVETVCIASNLWISEREEDGFQSSSDTVDTHNQFLWSSEDLKLIKTPFFYE